jgi:hypothetical protein
MWQPAGRRKRKRRSGGARVGEKGNGCIRKWRERGEANERAHGITPARGRAAQLAGVEVMLLRGRPTGGRGCTRMTEGGADARARARGEGRCAADSWGRQGKSPEKQSSSF